MVERAGFGASTPDPALSWDRHADDLAAILDAVGVETVPAYGGSGGAPYLLAFAARHPQRLSALSVVSGAAPIRADELDAVIELNAVAHRLAHAGDRDGMRRLLEPVRQMLLDDPLASVRTTMAAASPADRAIMSDPTWQELLRRGVREALRQGIDGWVDESMLMFAGWDALEPQLVRASVIWWHGVADMNCPLSAVRRLVADLPNAELHVWKDGGHLTAYRHEGEVLDELLSRAG